jgi:hypothetical protein
LCRVMGMVAFVLFVGWVLEYPRVVVWLLLVVALYGGVFVGIWVYVFLCGEVVVH